MVPGMRHHRIRFTVRHIVRRGVWVIRWVMHLLDRTAVFRPAVIRVAMRAVVVRVRTGLVRAPAVLSRAAA